MKIGVVKRTCFPWAGLKIAFVDIEAKYHWGLIEVSNNCEEVN
jgi:hypothetical protein